MAALDTYLEYSITRTHRFLEEIESLKESEFPYAHSVEALNALEKEFKKSLSSLIRAQDNKKNNKSILKKKCGDVLHDIKHNLPLLGFILRSTNVRNAFEVHGPLLRLASNVLEPDIAWNEKSTKLILSSEWTYSPFTFTEVPNLRGFVLIGSPAHEASNPLLIPLAGHELGHALWLSEGLSSQFLSHFNQLIRDEVLANWDKYTDIFFDHSVGNLSVTKTTFDITDDLIIQPTINKASAWLAKEAEETFCDCVGIRLFGLAYLKAFSYLIAVEFHVIMNSRIA